MMKNFKEAIELERMVLAGEKHPLAPGEKPPKGAVVVTGPRGGKYYITNPNADGDKKKPTEESPEEPKKESYISRYFAESDKINSEFTIEDSKGNTHIFDKEQVEAEINAMPKDIQKKIENVLTQIDFNNGDPNHFLEYVLKGLVS